jgi:hypothetical protein
MSSSSAVLIALLAQIELATQTRGPAAFDVPHGPQM